MSGTAREPSGFTPRPAPSLRAVAVLALLELRLARRRGESVLVTLVVPLAVLVFFASVDVLMIPGDPVDVLLPGAIALGIIAASFVSLGIATAYERQYGVLKRLGGAPIPRWSIVVAKITATLVVELVQVALLVSVAALLLDWRPGGGASLPAVLAAVLLGTAAFAGLGLALAGRLRAEAMLALANGLFLAFLLLGGVVIPLEHLPVPLASVGAVLPAAPLTELVRWGLGGAANPAPAAAILGAWAGGAIALAVRWFRWT